MLTAVIKIVTLQL